MKIYRTCNRCGYHISEVDAEIYPHCPICNSCGECGCCPCYQFKCKWCDDNLENGYTPIIVPDWVIIARTVAFAKNKENSAIS